DADHCPPHRSQRRCLRACNYHPGGGRPRNHRRRSDQGRGNPWHGGGRLGVTSEALATEIEPTGIRSYWTRIGDNVRSGNLGSWPVVIALEFIVLVFVEMELNVCK